jgi:hypothetical protein
MGANITLTDSQQGDPVLERGPLKALYRSPYTNIDNLQYPRDLGSDQKNHYVTFKIFDTDSFGVDDLKGGAAAAGDVISDTLLSSISTAAQKIGIDIPVPPPGESAAVSFTGVMDGISNLAAGKVNLTTRTSTTSSGSITLYMPEGLQFQTQAQYGELSVMQALFSILPTGSNSDKSKLSTVDKYKDKFSGIGGIAKLGLNYAGYTFNPQQQLMFEGINFRKFSMSFTFTPYSSSEAYTVNQIITKFRSSAAPTTVTGSFGFLFNPPSQFDISFKSNGNDNPYINKVKRCYLENVEVNYTPNGWAAHETDGAPVQTTMSLSFVETELIDRQAIADGY